MFDAEIANLAKRAIETLIAHDMTIATAESCTGGLIAGALTSISGSSAVVYGGFVTYANEAKMKMIAVPEQVLAEFGAVSEQTARAMAEGALRASGADIAIAVTGVAGPTGGTDEKPVGLVYFGCATTHETYYQERRYGDLGRDEIRMATVVTALKMVADVTRSDQP